MASITKQDLTTSYGTAITVPTGTKVIEVWGVDDNTTPTAMVGIWVEISDGTTVAPILTSTTSSYEKAIGLPSGVGGWTVRMKSTTGTPDGVVVFT
jgi:hypothetical protein